MNSRDKDELFGKTKDTYTSTNGIKIKRTFNENGKDITKLFQDYFKRCLEDHWR